MTNQTSPLESGIEKLKETKHPLPMIRLDEAKAILQALESKPDVSSIESKGDAVDWDKLDHEFCVWVDFNTDNEATIFNWFKTRLQKPQLEKREEKLIEVQTEYIRLLSEELSEISDYATRKGWESTRYEQGKICRETIARLSQPSDSEVGDE